MTDPDLDSGLETDYEGRIDILQSEFFGVGFGSEITVQDYVNQIYYTFVVAVEGHSTRVVDYHWTCTSTSSSDDDLDNGWDYSCHCHRRGIYEVNVTIGLKEDRMMMTGMHTVSDIFCVGCGSNVGWKYVAAYDKGQKYKEGKFILERFKVSGPDGSHYWANHESHVGGSDAEDA